MLQGLIFGLVSLFTPQADLPHPTTLEGEKSRFAVEYRLDMSNVSIKEATWKNPSPLLASATRHGCTIYINQYDKAHQVWAYLVSDESIPLEQFMAFSMGHELTHCLVGRTGVRADWRKQLENHLAIKFQSNAHFEETLGDLVGLAYASKVFPQDADALIERIESIRHEFAGHDDAHNSTHALSRENIEWAERLIKTKSAPVRSASREEGGSEPPSPT